jgi:hypothetical protein
MSQIILIIVFLLVVFRERIVEEVLEWAEMTREAERLFRAFNRAKGFSVRYLMRSQFVIAIFVFTEHGWPSAGALVRLEHLDAGTSFDQILHEVFLRELRVGIGTSMAILSVASPIRILLSLDYCVS